MSSGEDETEIYTRFKVCLNDKLRITLMAHMYGADTHRHKNNPQLRFYTVWSQSFTRKQKTKTKEINDFVT